MKKTLSLLILLISLLSFGQEKEYGQAFNLFNIQKYEESLVIVDKLLNKEFGELSKELEIRSLRMRFYSYYRLKNYEKAYGFAISYLEIVKNSTNLFSDEYKKIAIDEVEKFIANIKSKISSEQAIASNAKTNNSDKQITESKSASDNKTVTITVSGTGKTIEEAKTNALRSAIEQAFGAFVSSKTEILNDSVVKDEVVSVSSGNIQKYDVVSQLEIPNNGYAMTLNATVSIEKLTSFAESKGVSVEFKGGMFAQNIRLQKLNEQAEYIALKNLCKTSFELLLNSIDYNLEIGPPISNNNVKLGVGTGGQMIESLQKMYNYMYDLKNGVYIKKFNSDDFSIAITVNLKSNKNFKLFYENFVKTIVSMSMDASEIKNYETIGKSIIPITIGGKEYFLRNPKCDNILKVFFTKAELIPRFFSIENNIYEFNNLLINRYSDYHDYNFTNWQEKAYSDWDRLVGYEDFAQLIANKINILPFFDDLFSAEYQNEDYEKMREDGISYKNSYVFDYKDFQDSFVLYRSFTEEEIGKLDRFEIKKFNLLEVLKKEEERLKKVRKIKIRTSPDRILELNGEKAKEDKYYGFNDLTENSINYGELIEIKDKSYIIKSINSNTNEPGLLYRLIPDKYSIIKEEGFFYPNDK